MAHPCFECGGECYCCGDIDDCIVSKTPKRCEGCGCEEMLNEHREEGEELEDFDEDENEVLDCPNCQRAYDDADADYLICHHCGYDATTKTVDRRKISGRNMLGLDADANDVWL